MVRFLQFAAVVSVGVAERPGYGFDNPQARRWDGNAETPISQYDIPSSSLQQLATQRRDVRRSPPNFPANQQPANPSDVYSQDGAWRPSPQDLQQPQPLPPQVPLYQRQEWQQPQQPQYQPHQYQRQDVQQQPLQGVYQPEPQSYQGGVYSSPWNPWGYAGLPPSGYGASVMQTARSSYKNIVGVLAAALDSATEQVRMLQRWAGGQDFGSSPQNGYSGGGQSYPPPSGYAYQGGGPSAFIQTEDGPTVLNEAPRGHHRKGRAQSTLTPDGWRDVRERRNEAGTADGVDLR